MDPSCLTALQHQSNEFVTRHHVGTVASSGKFSGQFGLHSGTSEPDLYGIVDAVYTLYTSGSLIQQTDRASRRAWADRILACQCADGWFSKRNLRGHSQEHATAYAIGALRLLELEPDENYVRQIRPLEALLPLLIDQATCWRWIDTLDFRLAPLRILKKNVGWHYIWRGSHIGGGIPAAIGMSRDWVEQWWPSRVNIDQWFDWYFDWLDAHVNPKTGYWQRAFWNAVYRNPTLIDMGGAVHFFWIYEAMRRPFPYPEAIIDSTLSLQQSSGLYKDHPFCIDLDGNFCVVRAYLQLSPARQEVYRDRVYHAVETNFEAIVRALTTQPLEEIYDDSHGLPGALAALVECTKLPGFKYTEALSDWRHPLDRAWWL
jgi:hypothetical protein